MNKYISIKCLAVFFLVLVEGCSSGEEEVWPELKADPLWEKIKKDQQNPPSPEEFLQQDSETGQSEGIAPEQTLRKGDGMTLEVLRAEFDRHSRTFVAEEHQLREALDKYDAQKTSQNWLSIEFYKSRLNGRSGELKNIVALASQKTGPAYQAILKEATNLLHKISELQKIIMVPGPTHEQEE